MTRPRPTWSPEAEAYLIALYVARVPAKKIARQLDRSLTMVTDHIQRLCEEGRMPRRNRRWSPAADKVLLAALAVGCSYEDLAEVFTSTPRAIQMRALMLQRRIRAEAANDQKDQLQLELAG